DKADSIFKMLKDLEGEAVIMFNMALLKLEMGDLEDAISLFREWYSKSRLLTSPPERKVMRDDFIKRASEKGYTDMEGMIGDGQ
ncbi:MAG: tetratricopeptide repeat protein, partial [Thermoplasmatota archaeon]